VASPAPGSDQSQLELGNNLLVYTSAPLEAPLHVFGRPRVTLHAATSAASADLTAKLVRLTPAGRAEFVCIGIARSTQLFAADTYIPDTAHAWAFPLEPTSCVFAPGDRIRLEVAGCAFPLYDRNPGVPGVAPSQASRWNWTRSTHTLFHDPEHPSALHLPILQTPEGDPA
jgi:putative CocE/NonD family hydrolase